MLTADSERIANEPAVAGGSPAGDARQETSGKPDQARGVPCSNCQQPLPEKKMTVCPHCGYYFSLGICIELDKTWERLASGQPPQPAEAQEQARPKSQLELMLELVPAWGWKLIGCHAAVIVVSILVRLLIPSGFVRTLWSVTQLFSGLLAFMTCHAIAYLISIADDASMNLLDVILKPLKLWKDIFRGLPKRFRLAAIGTCGVTAFFCSLWIIGDLNYSVLLDWGIKAPPQQNLMGAILAQAQQAEAEEKSLEDAVGDFAGQAGDLTADKLAKPEKKVRVDCVIVGYTIDPRDPDAISSLLVAREIHGRLKFVGRLVDGISDGVRTNLLEELAEVPRATPFVTVPPHISAKWVQPQYFCRVKCVRETQSGSLIDAEFDDLLGRSRMVR